MARVIAYGATEKQPIDAVRVLGLKVIAEPSQAS